MCQSGTISRTQKQFESWKRLYWASCRCRLIKLIKQNGNKFVCSRLYKTRSRTRTYTPIYVCFINLIIKIKTKKPTRKQPSLETNQKCTVWWLGPHLFRIQQMEKSSYRAEPYRAELVPRVSQRKKNIFNVRSNFGSDTYLEFNPESIWKPMKRRPEWCAPASWFQPMASCHIFRKLQGRKRKLRKARKDGVATVQPGWISLSTSSTPRFLRFLEWKKADFETFWCGHWMSDPVLKNPPRFLRDARVTKIHHPCAHTTMFNIKICQWHFHTGSQLCHVRVYLAKIFTPSGDTER